MPPAPLMLDPRRIRTWSLPLAIAGALLLAGCVGSIENTDAHGDDGHDDEGDHHGEQAAPAPPPNGPIDLRLKAESGTKANELGITPNPIHIAVGKNVELTVTNNGGAPHTFTVHGYGLDTGRLMPGETKVLSFNAAKKGTFEIMCDEPGHYQAGMKASFVVEDAH